MFRRKTTDDTAAVQQGRTHDLKNGQASTTRPQTMVPRCSYGVHQDEEKFIQQGRVWKAVDNMADGGRIWGRSHEADTPQNGSHICVNQNLQERPDVRDEDCVYIQDLLPVIQMLVKKEAGQVTLLRFEGGRASEIQPGRPYWSGMLQPWHFTGSQPKATTRIAKTEGGNTLISLCKGDPKTSVSSWQDQ
ncbi:uncharacterized protein LOC106964719 [Poecilia latipinna]|uniref:uncharacterized protein LOC106964719 n=1 Tax=Poecilia latipinna TaxID=48699 RepID=UPI00072EE43F|nr:PREDICTED: uncharacterized protein LOC106964719 [Poecilia latipinna]